MTVTPYSCSEQHSATHTPASGIPRPRTTAPQPAQTRPAYDRRRRGRLYSIGEEIANAVTHGVGVLLGIAALVLLLVQAALHGGGIRVLAALLMGITLILEYLFSTLYHAIQPKAAKKILRIMDHCGIYLLIAGSYAPFALISLQNDGGWILCLAVWVIALIGIGLEIWMKESQPAWLTALIFVLMGWMVVFRWNEILANLHPAAFWLLLCGGLSYTLGAVLYAFKKVPYMHFVFHLFILAGSVCVTLSAILFVV